MRRALRILRCALVLLIADSTMVNLRGHSGATASLDSSFESYGVVPDVVPVAPPALACVRFPSGAQAHLGNDISPVQALVAPTVTYDADPDQFYTIAMVGSTFAFLDSDEPQQPKLRHWLVGNVPGSDVRAGDVLSPYVPTAPPPTFGRLRYAILVYRQPGRIQFEEQALLSLSAAKILSFSIVEFAEKYHLDIIAGNFFQSGILKNIGLLKNKIANK